jgi:hypothetical protein
MEGRAESHHAYRNREHIEDLILKIPIQKTEIYAQNVPLVINGSSIGLEFDVS